MIHSDLSVHFKIKFLHFYLVGIESLRTQLIPENGF